MVQWFNGSRRRKRIEYLYIGITLQNLNILTKIGIFS